MKTSISEIEDKIMNGDYKINSFSDRKPMLRKFYKRFMKSGKKIIIEKYGKQKGESLLREFWETFESLIPEMPLIRKDDNLLERQVLLQTIYLSIYKTLKKQGENVEDIWNICSDIVEQMLGSMPSFVKWIARKSLFSDREKKREMKSAKISQESNYDEDFVFEYVEGDKNNFDYGINMTQCAACKFYKRQNAEELIPFVCKTDHLFSKHFGYKLIRTQTIADGYDYCDFRFKR